MATKLCPFKKIRTTRIINDNETVVDIEFALCDGRDCMAYNVYDTINCALIRREA